MMLSQCRHDPLSSSSMRGMSCNPSELHMHSYSSYSLDIVLGMFILNVLRLMNLRGGCGVDCTATLGFRSCTVGMSSRA